MAVTLAESARNTQEDYDPAVINEFRKTNAVLDLITFDDVVNPAGGGATLTYGYRRQKTQRNAAFRAYNTEYSPEEVETEQFNTTLAVLGGSFQIDRVLAKLGPAASGQIALQMSNTIEAASAKFNDALINGDKAVDANGFDGLDKALAGSSTEITSTADWTDWDTDPRSAHKALDLIDDFLGELDGAPTAILCNKRVLSRLRAAARRSGEYVKAPVDGLIGANGRPVEREMYGGITFVDPGNKPGTNDPVIPIDGATGLSDLYAVRFALDGFHGVSTMGGQVVQTWLPDFSTSGAVKTGEVELGPVGCALKKTKAAAVLRGIKVA